MSCAERGRAAEQPVAADEFGAVPGEAAAIVAILCRKIEEPDVAGIGRTEPVGRQHGPGLGFHRGHDMQRGAIAILAKHPLDVERHRQTARNAAEILQRELEHFDVVTARHEQGQLRRDVAMDMFVDGVALAVAGRVFLPLARRQRGRRPERPSVFVPDEERFTGRVADRIVPPGREPVVVAVVSPGVAGPGLGAGEPERLVSDDVGPGRRRHRDAGCHLDGVLAPVVQKSTHAIGQLETAIRMRRSDRDRGDGTRRFGHRTAGLSRREGGVRAGELVAKVAVGGVHDAARRGPQQELIVGGHEIGAPEEDTARFVDPALFGSGFDHRLELLLQVLQVAGRMLVEDDEIERQSLEAQVLVRLEHLGDERDAGGVSQSDEQDRQVPGNAMRPQVALPALIAFDRLEIAQARVARHQAAAKPLELDGVFGRQHEMPQLDLAVGARQRQRAGDGAAVVILRDQPVRVLFGLGVPGRECNPAGGARRETHRVAKADDRIEDRPGRIRERRAGIEGERAVERAPAADEAGAVGFPLRRGPAAAAATEDVDEELPVAARPRTPHRDQARRTRAPTGSRRIDC